jgi:hypothetical protein
MRDVDGDTPLHSACRCGAPIEVLRVLLEANPSVVNERDYEGLTPLLRLWVRCFVMLGGDDALDNIKGFDDLNGELADTWRKTELLLRCAYMGSLTGPINNSSNNYVSALPPNYNFRIVHAVSAVDCPRPVVKMAAVLYPKQLEELDEVGMTPLLIASRAPIFKVRDLSDEGFMLEDRVYGDSENGNDDMNDDERTDSIQPSVLDILVNAGPRAACIACTNAGPWNGRLPLHVAIAAGKPWTEGIKGLLAAYPDAISIIDPQTGLFPFLQAAATDRQDCGTILELLKKDPSLTLAKTTRSISPSSFSSTPHTTRDVMMCNSNARSQHGMTMVCD